MERKLRKGSEDNTDFSNNYLTCQANRANMSPSKGSKKTDFSSAQVSIMFAEVADKKLVQQVLNMLLQAQLGKEGDDA